MRRSIKNLSHIPDFGKVVWSINQRARSTTLEMVREFAGAELELFKEALMEQDFPAFHEVPLSARWLARKAAANADLRTMLATHHYIESIKVFTEINRDGSVTIHVGFDRDATARDLNGHPTNFPLYRVAQIQEHGSAAANIPPRPHWSVQRQRMAAKAPAKRREIAEEIVRRVRADLRRTLR